MPGEFSLIHQGSTLSNNSWHITSVVLSNLEKKINLEIYNKQMLPSVHRKRYNRFPRVPNDDGQENERLRLRG